MPQDTRRYEHRQWDALIGNDQGLLATPDHFLAPRATAGTITLPTPGANVQNAVSQIQVSFWGTPAATTLLTVQHGAGTAVFQAYITAGNNVFNFEPPRLAPADTAILIGITPTGGTVTVAVTAGTVTPAPYRV